MEGVRGVRFESVYREIIKRLMEKGGETSPRGMRTKEICPFYFSVDQIRNRIITWPKRKWNIFLAFGEFMWIMAGSDSLNMILPFNKAWSKFSDDGMSLNGAYGKRLITRGGNQIERVIQMLQADPDSRQAIVHIHDSQDLFHLSKDIPCTSHLQFFIRRNELRMVVYMRSNDIILGTAYDFFVFSMIQEYVARRLGIEPFHYTHINGSMHIYENNWDYIENVDDEIRWGDLIHMPEMTLDGYKDAMNIYIGLTTDLTMSSSYKGYEDIIMKMTDTYWRDICILLYIRVLKYYNIEDLKYYDSLLQQLAFQEYTNIARTKLV